MSLRRMARALPFFALFGGATAQVLRTENAAQFPEDYLPTLRPILANALRQSPQVIAKQLELDQSALRVMGANSLRLPSLGGNLTYATNETAVRSRT